MRLADLFVSVAVAAGVFVVGQGCGILKQDAATSDDKICTPGAYVFCRCADRTQGTKLCHPDGKTFDPCATNDTGACVGGEIPDPQTNQPVDPPTNGPPPTNGVDTTKPGGELDVCPGKATALVPGVEVDLSGDTTTAINDRDGATGGACAVGGGANDHLYRLTPSGSGTVSVSVTSTGTLDPVAYIRTACDDKASQKGCGAPTPQKVASFTTQLKTGITYFLVIDGASGTTGPYTAKLKLSTQLFCGDGIVSAGEACDDGGNDDGDGCGPDCRSVNGNPTSAGACPGQSVDMWPNAHQGTPTVVSGEGTTAGSNNTFGSPDTSCGDGTTGNTNPDHVYHVIPHGTGTLNVKLSAPASGTLATLMLSARTTCDKGTTQVACAKAGDSSAAGMNVPVTSGQDVYVAVDGGDDTAAASGPYKITFSLTQ